MTEAASSHDAPRSEIEAALWPEPHSSPSRSVRCRHCSALNRVVVSSAALYPGRHRCGRCDASLFIELSAALERVSPAAYQHGLDRRTVAALRSIPGLPRYVRKVLRAVGDRSAQALFMSEAIECSPEQFPELVELVSRACARLDVQQRPAIFLGESPHMNAMTTGVGRPVLVVRSALLDQMSDQEVLAVIGHELGHLQAEHPLYGTMAQALLHGWANASPGARGLAWPVHGLMLRWLRYAELTADRAALLASGSLEACIKMMLTFAGGNRPGTSNRTQIRLSPFIRQCRKLAKLESRSMFQGLIGGYLTMNRTHPPVASRVIHLIEWVEHGNYLDILAGDYIERSPRQTGARSTTQTVRGQLT